MESAPENEVAQFSAKERWQFELHRSGNLETPQRAYYI